MVMSALPPKADVCGALAYVCFGPKADILATRSEHPNLPLGALGLVSTFEKRTEPAPLIALHPARAAVQRRSYCARHRAHALRAQVELNAPVQRRLGDARRRAHALRARVELNAPVQRRVGDARRRAHALRAQVELNAPVQRRLGLAPCHARALRAQAPHQWWRAHAYAAPALSQSRRRRAAAYPPICPARLEQGQLAPGC